jgi:hypothetical protein
MAFEIKPIDIKIFRSIWVPEVQVPLDRLIYPTENWTDELSDSSWAVDHLEGAYVIKVVMSNRMDGANCYVLVKNSEFALIRNVRYGIYTVVKVSTGFENSLDQVYSMVEEALLLGGERLNGEGAKYRALNGYWPVSTVQFVPYVKPVIEE